MSGDSERSGQLLIAQEMRSALLARELQRFLWILESQPPGNGADASVSLVKELLRACAQLANASSPVDAAAFFGRAQEQLANLLKSSADNISHYSLLELDAARYDDLLALISSGRLEYSDGSRWSRPNMLDWSIKKTLIWHGIQLNPNSCRMMHQHRIDPCKLIHVINEWRFYVRSNKDQQFGVTEQNRWQKDGLVVCFGPARKDGNLNGILVTQLGPSTSSQDGAITYEYRD